MNPSSSLKVLSQLHVRRKYNCFAHNHTTVHWVQWKDKNWSTFSLGDQQARESGWSKIGNFFFSRKIKRRKTATWMRQKAPLSSNSMPHLFCVYSLTCSVVPTGRFCLGNHSNFSSYCYNQGVWSWQTTGLCLTWSHEQVCSFRGAGQTNGQLGQDSVIMRKERSFFKNEQSACVFPEASSHSYLYSGRKWGRMIGSSPVIGC